ncbi:hypothetical protein MMC13_001080 [Lambiella insularis]|nr:hypothetical protein [Lambiella insularis]
MYITVNFYNHIWLRKSAFQDAQSLAYQLARFSGHLCSDPRDKIYSLLAIINHGNTIQPDYSLPVSTLYQQVALSTIQSTKSLHVLAYASFTGRGEDIPSWVPDWRFCKSFEAEITAGLFKASGSTLADFKPTRSGDIRFSGLFFDEIVSVSVHPGEASKYSALDAPLSVVQATYVQWEEFAGLPQDKYEIYVGGGKLLEAFYRTICGGELFNRKSFRWERLQELNFSLVKRYYSWLRDTDSKKQQDTPTEVLNETDPRYFVKLFRDRAFYRTRKGFIGLGPRYTSLGDEVFVLAGGASPFILRQDQTQFVEGGVAYPSHSLIGYTYVDGIMDGEAIKGIQAGQEEWQDMYLH